MKLTECCDDHCTSCRICYLKLLRPGDTVPFKPPKYILLLGAFECLFAVVIIVLDVLAIYSQSRGLTSPPPSFLGSPGIPIWLAVVLVFDGCTNIAAYKRKTRFSTAIAFGFSVLATLLVTVLLAVLTMAISQEQNVESSTGITIAIIMCLLDVILLFVTSLAALTTYLSLTSHDDRWFTDRGTQHDPPATSTGNNGRAQLSVPSGEPAFLFYAPSNDALKYSKNFQSVIRNMETSDKTRNVDKEAFDDEMVGGRKTADMLSDDEGTYITTAPSSAVRQKRIPEHFLAETRKV